MYQSLTKLTPWDKQRPCLCCIEKQVVENYVSVWCVHAHVHVCMHGGHTECTYMRKGYGMQIYVNKHAEIKCISEQLSTHLHIYILYLQVHVYIYICIFYIYVCIYIELFKHK